MQLSEKIHPVPTRFPEKVLQFGTGVLLRGLCDYHIDRANQQGIFNGSVVIVKSTSGSVDDFARQDNLYTICIRGINRGNTVNENYVVSCISRVIAAADDWAEVLKTAHNKDLKIVISNTTEVGLTYTGEKISLTKAPESFPAKLTSWLWERFEANKKRVVVVPTELLVDNGRILEEAVRQTAAVSDLGHDFTEWLNKKVSFCSSLVDRIVPGKPAPDKLKVLYDELGYQDNFLTMAEAYSLWAIEGDAKAKEILDFYEVSRDVKIEKSIQKYRDLKLRLLNGSHTLMCGLSYLAGFEFVKDVMSDNLMEKYITILMLTELAPAIPADLDTKITQRYGREVLDRFRNPSLDHRWLSITLQFTMKMRMRCIPTLLKYYDVFETVPQYFARCFAAYLLFMKSTKVENGVYYGENNGTAYAINCDSAPYFHEVWQSNSTHELVQLVLSNEELWGVDLTQLPDFAENVEIHLCNMQSIGVREVASALNVYA